MAEITTQTETTEQVKHATTLVSLLNWLEPSTHKTIARLYKTYKRSDTNQSFTEWLTPLAEQLDKRATAGLSIPRGFRLSQKILDAAFHGGTAIMQDIVKHMLGLGDSPSTTLKAYHAYAKGKPTKAIVQSLVD